MHRVPENVKLQRPAAELIAIHQRLPQCHMVNNITSAPPCSDCLHLEHGLQKWLNNIHLKRTAEKWQLLNTPHS
jgi:hypothetical protein